MAAINATDDALRGNSGTVAGDEVFAKDVFVVVIVTFV